LVLSDVQTRDRYPNDLLVLQILIVL
jgi:hypothetical protein